MIRRPPRSTPSWHRRQRQMCIRDRASIVRKKVGFPRIAITVPSIVIMVPGLYMYRAVFNFGITNINIGAYWIVEALMIVVALLLGLLAARILTDKKWRHAD